MSLKVGIHQPNFMPWMGYFNKIHRSDIFVIIDDVQFAKGSVCNRCKIKNNMGEEVWLTVPVRPENGSASTFNEMKIAEPAWHHKALNLLKASYIKAPYFNTYYPVIENLFKKEYNSLAEMNITLIRFFCDSLHINTPIYIQSQIPEEFGKKNDLNLGITKHFKGDIYLSGGGAKKYNDHDLFLQQGVSIEYQEYKVPMYNQINGNFIEGLSIIDTLFNEGEKSASLVCINK
jgi:hypothetical protein